MTHPNTFRGSFTIGLLVASGIYAGCGSNGGSGSEPSAGAAGAIGLAGSASASTAGANTAGGASTEGGASTLGGAATAGGASTLGGAGSSSGGSSGSAAGGHGGMNSGAAGSSGAHMGGNTGTSGGSNGGSGGAGSVNCATKDPLKTNNTKQDAYDCAIIDVANKWGFPDPMIIKSQIQQESSFQIFAISGDSPCGTMAGWTDAESKSFGLIQTTPACGEAKGSLLPNGHPNLTQDMNSAQWATSVFNPPINLDSGVQTDAASRKSLKAKYAGCTDAQYSMMAAGAFNSGDSAVLGCTSYNTRAQMYVTFITQHYKQFATAAGWPDPY
ncbi:MAG TPA: hypothetical protein VGF76_04150 [Polyangiaceae bacterium]